MDLKEFRATVLRLDRPEDVLKLADSYLTRMQEMGDKFILPREHVLVKPALEYYAGDLAGWVKFVKSVRDRLPKDGRTFHQGIQELYRTLEIRLTQQERRERLDAAVAVAVKKRLIDDDYDSKMRYARRCTQVWKIRRDNLLKAHIPKKGRISLEERDELLTKFWEDIMAEIRNGEVPKP
jgi:hypothetical protein